MIKLYRKENSQQADHIEAEFHKMILGYDCIVVAEQDARQMFGEGRPVEIYLPDNLDVDLNDRRPFYFKTLYSRAS